MAACAVALLAGAAAPELHAVTDAEMDHARAVAAQWYLRWANNGSDYLDNLSPKSMAELEGKLKAKEKENLKAFKSVKTPTDYASWDKDKLVEYWGVTFFKSAGLDEQGKGARNRVKKSVAQISVAESAETPAAAQEAASELPSAAPDSASPAASAAEMPGASEIVDEVAAADSAMAADAAAEKTEQKKSSSSTWLYIVALVVLVGVVVWLVIFASKTMQGGADGEKSADGKDSDGEAVRKKPAPVAEEPERRGRTVVYSSVEEDDTRQPVYEASGDKNDSQLREKFVRTLASKDEEIRVLHREINDLREECMRLGEENGRLTSDLTLANRELEALRGRLRAANVVTSAASSAPSGAGLAPASRRRMEIPRPAESAPERTRHQDGIREIYLGRVNSKGIFVRADRRPVEGKSVFVLTTSDGYTGSYRVLQSASAIDMALDHPEHYLAGGCVAPDITDTAEADGIRTVTAGTAVFEDGCWRLLRKAKIAYE